MIPSPDGRRHTLKVWPNFFEALLAQRKTFEVRRADRPYEVGDVLDMREWHPVELRFTGRTLERRVLYIMAGGAFGLDVNFCIMALGVE